MNNLHLAIFVQETEEALEDFKSYELALIT